MIAPKRGGRDIFVHLAYLDDSGTKDKSSRFQVMAGVIVDGSEFRNVELAVGALIETLVPESRREQFEEFHAWELFQGCGPFDGVETGQRLGVISAFLAIVSDHKIPIVYGSVDLEGLSDQSYASADPLDICFRNCVRGIDLWASRIPISPPPVVSRAEYDAHPLVVLICDDFQTKTKESIRRSFRSLRSKVRPPTYSPGKTWFLHDDLYFGSSKESVGIQLADITAYIVRKKLEGQKEVSRFFDVIKEQVVYSGNEPRIAKQETQAQSAGS